MATMKYLLAACLLLVTVMQVNAVFGDVCFDILGCFSMLPPWRTLDRPIPNPENPAVINTRFYVYTRSQLSGVNITTRPISLAGSNYDGSKPTFFIIQGFKVNVSNAWLFAGKDALLNEFDANVIIVDWNAGSCNYFQAVSNARIIAAEIKRLAAYFVSDKNAAAARMHLIGLSLGAHIAAYVGKAMPGIARITALDAAQPLFENNNPLLPYSELVRLVKTDALFVEVIHTNARPLYPLLGFGYMAAIGHVDFYVNGGFMQPGCVTPLSPPSVPSLAQLGTFMVDVVKMFAYCPHVRSFELLLASIVNKTNIMWGHKVTIVLPAIYNKTLVLSTPTTACTKDTCSPLGIQTSNYPARGVFFVKTTGASPFFIKEDASDTTMAPFKILPTAAL